MKRIILFRFHKAPRICKDRLQILKKYNPEVKIYGLYGGKKKDLPMMKRYLKNDLEHIYVLGGKGVQNWLHSDIAVNQWYIDYGKNIDFDMLHITEWDMLFFDSMDNIYNHIPKNYLGLTGLRDLKGVEHRWTWTSKEPWKSQWIRLLKIVKQKYGYNKKPKACLAGAACLPRAFIEMNSKLNLPALGNDELRLPLAAQILGFKCKETGMYPLWCWGRKDLKHYHAHKYEIKLENIKNELKKKNGKRVFHPYWHIISHKL